MSIEIKYNTSILKLIVVVKYFSAFFCTLFFVCLMPPLLIYIIACLEGFTTLAVQMIILRLAIPITGSSIVVTSIFLWVILLALSCGYWYGGRIAERSQQQGSVHQYQLTRILWVYLLLAGLWYLLLVIPYQRDILQWMMHHVFYEWALFLVAILLFFVPIFLASQTIPILTELIPISSKGRSAGLIFFVSTIGSFLGSIVTTLFLFPLLWVFQTWVIVSGLLIWLGLLSWTNGFFTAKHHSYQDKIMISMAILSLWVLWWMFYQDHVYARDVLKVYDSSYQEIIVRDYRREGKPVRIFHTNRSFASGFDPVLKQSPFEYIRHMVDITKILQPKRVLLIGAAGFVYPYEISKFDFLEQIDAIDIDPKVKDIAETYLLQEPLSAKVHFIAESARYAVRRLASEGKRYDLIIVDAFLWRSVPAELVTQEFMQDLLEISSNKHILWNMILDNNLSSDFAQRFLATAQSAFGAVWSYDVMQDEHRTLWSTTNMMIATQPFSSWYQLWNFHNETLYRDDKNSAEIDAILVSRQ